MDFLKRKPMPPQRSSPQSSDGLCGAEKKNEHANRGILKPENLLTTDYLTRERQRWAAGPTTRDEPATSAAVSSSSAASAADAAAAVANADADADAAIEDERAKAAADKIAARKGATEAKGKAMAKVKAKQAAEEAAVAKEAAAAEEARLAKATAARLAVHDLARSFDGRTADQIDADWELLLTESSLSAEKRARLDETFRAEDARARYTMLCEFSTYLKPNRAAPPQCVWTVEGLQLSLQSRSNAEHVRRASKDVMRDISRRIKRISKELLSA